jgi:hypothetical protein
VHFPEKHHKVVYRDVKQIHTCEWRNYENAFIGKSKNIGKYWSKKGVYAYQMMLKEQDKYGYDTDSSDDENTI